MKKEYQKPEIVEMKKTYVGRLAAAAASSSVRIGLSVKKSTEKNA